MGSGTDDKPGTPESSKRYPDIEENYLASLQDEAGKKKISGKNEIPRL